MHKRQTLVRFLLLPRRCLLALITLYQRTLSPDHGALKALEPYGYCRHEPTCSEYTKRAIERTGILPGLAMGCWRLLHCTPWSRPDEKALKRASDNHS